MKLAISFTNTMIVSEENQAEILAIISNSTFYKPGNSWDESTDYTLCPELPKISFVSDNRLLGYEEALKASQVRESADSSKYYKLYNEKNESDKMLKEANEKLAELAETHSKALQQARECLEVI